MRSSNDYSDTTPNGRGDATQAPAQARWRTARTGVANEVAHLITDIEDLVKQATSLTGDELTAAKAKLAERLATARASMTQMGDSVATQARTTVAATNEYVHEQPWKSIGIGATVGLLLGFALARR
jgi:ElaB/YqjD/DUF883 family membrane-anchored ribosome-binding protein